MASACYTAVSRGRLGCRVSCIGLYADVEFTENDSKKQAADQATFDSLQDRYHTYKGNYARNLQFDPNHLTLGMITKSEKNVILYCSAKKVEFAPLKLVQIYFDTATYDEIKRDVKVTLEAQLGLIGGTMGLLTGFSILSGVEIVYFITKFMFSLRAGLFKT